jgi:type IV pilus assembly protein PilC
MALIVTPRRLAAFADFYRRLAQLTVAGVPLILALKNLRQHPPAHDFRAPLDRTLTELADGATFSQAIQLIPGWLPTFDAALLEAGEQSGRLDKSMSLLADFYEERARNARQMLSDLAYPVMLLHFAIFILPFPQLFLTGDVGAYLLKTLGFLVPLYAVVMLGLMASQGRHGEAWRALMERVCGAIPLLGAARQNLALARLTAALGALLNAGVNIFQAWEMAANASGSPALRRAVANWRPQLEAGETPGELLSQNSVFPDLFVSHYRAGEVSGSLDESLGHLHHLYFEEGTRQARTLARWVPRGIYLAVVLLIAWRILQFWLGYFGQIQNALGG